MSDKTERIDPDNPVQMCAVMRLRTTLQQNVEKLGALAVADILAHGSYSPTDGSIGIVIGGCRISEATNPDDA